jgi:hypothetical protein
MAEDDELQRRVFLGSRCSAMFFRGKVIAGLRDAFHSETLRLPRDFQRLAEERAFATWLRTLLRRDSIVYAKPPFVGPSARSSDSDTSGSRTRAARFEKFVRKGP